MKKLFKNKRFSISVETILYIPIMFINICFIINFSVNWANKAMLYETTTELFAKTAWQVGIVAFSLSAIFTTILFILAIKHTNKKD